MIVLLDDRLKVIKCEVAILEVNLISFKVVRVHVKIAV